MTLTAAGRKTMKGTVGNVWDLSVKATAVPTVDGDTAHPVRFHVTTPDHDTRVVVATPVDDHHDAGFVLDRPGEYTATAVIVADDGTVLEELDGFKATADPQGDAPEPDTTPDEPVPTPADAA